MIKINGNISNKKSHTRYGSMAELSSRPEQVAKEIGVIVQECIDVPAEKYLMKSEKVRE